MKLSFVLSTQPTRFAAVAFARDFEANVAHLAKLGFDGVELAVREPARLDVNAVKQLLDAHRLRVPALGTGQAYVEERLSFTDPDASVRQRAVERIEAHIELARVIARSEATKPETPAMPSPLVIIGLIRGKGQTNATDARAWMLDALKHLARAARAQNVRLVIEPINRYETDLINTVADARAVIEQVGADNLGILFDTFHANIEEPRIEESLRACGSRLFHVHIADSNRLAPGAGHTDFARIFAALRAIDYAGWVSAEILPTPDIPRAAEQTYRTIKPLL